MDANREIDPPLTELLYEIAEDDADEEATNHEGTVWAGLLRDGEDVAARLTEQIEADGTVARDQIDDEDWAAIHDAFGIIVRRDNRRHRITARTFGDEVDLLDEWEATKADLMSAAPIEAAEMGDSTEGPSSGPVPPPDDPEL
jgi:hypothetical protein